MNLISELEVKKLLKKYQIRPLKRLGQNFLIDKGVIEKIVGAAELSPNDIVLEIGPGIGNLTQELAKKAKKVIAVEKDPKMIEILNNLLECLNVRNVKIVKTDILKIDPKPYTQKPYKIVASLPFYLTSPVIRQFLENKTPPTEMVLVVQKEVAQRICAKPPKMSILAVSVRFYAKPEIISYISKKSFWPVPKVDGTILRIVPLIHADRKPINADLFFKVARAGFSHPRKQLINNLSKKLKLEKEKVEDWLLENNIQPTQRAETLTLLDWLNLTRSCRMK